jgi:hypothetical protein
MLRRSGRSTLAAALSAVSLVAVGCGSSDHPNDPRPPPPIVLSVEVDDGRISVSPDEFGAGIVNFEIANTSDAEVQLQVKSVPGAQPVGGEQGKSEPIPPGGTGNLKLDFCPDFPKDCLSGDFEVNAGDESVAAPAEIRVQGVRKSASDELLEP